MCGRTPTRHAGHAYEREYSNLARTRLKMGGAYHCDAYTSQYAITHVGTQDYQMRRTESWDILNLIIVDHVTYLAIFSRSEISDFIQKILEYINHLRICFIYS